MEILQKKTSKHFLFYQNNMEKKKKMLVCFLLKFQKVLVFFFAEISKRKNASEILVVFKRGESCIHTTFFLGLPKRKLYVYKFLLKKKFLLLASLD